jgi:hypothetical protein
MPIAASSSAARTTPPRGRMDRANAQHFRIFTTEAQRHRGTEMAVLRGLRRRTDLSVPLCLRGSIFFRSKGAKTGPHTSATVPIRPDL